DTGEIDQAADAFGEVTQQVAQLLELLALGGQDRLELAEECTGQVLLPREPPGVEGHDGRPFPFRKLVEVVPHVAQYRGLPGAPGAVEREHQSIATRITADAVGQALGKRCMPEEIVLRVGTGPIGRKCRHAEPSASLVARYRAPRRSPCRLTRPSASSSAMAVFH